MRNVCKGCLPLVGLLNFTGSWVFCRVFDYNYRLCRPVSYISLASDQLDDIKKLSLLVSNFFAADQANILFALTVLRPS